MTKKCILFLFCLWLFAALQAKEVSKDVATNAAIAVMGQYVPGFQGSVQSVKEVTYKGEKSYYIVQFTPQGWVLIAADDRSTPVLGYSPKGTFRSEGQPENLKAWLNGYDEQIYFHAHQQGTRHEKWETLGQKPATRAATDKISPLITVNWNQGRPYNQFCPSNTSGTAVVGCVAVAMAQAMSVVQYPAKPQGQYSYVSPTYGTLYIDYDQEPAYDWNAIMTGANGKVEVARLLYHCGVSIDMNYGVDGSGTQTSYIPKALVRNFGYPSSVKYYSRTNYDGDWEQLILNELKAGRAVCYSGADLKKGYGHCFNLDGYDGTFFHVNWGWGGSNNGYFPIDGLRDNTMNMDYTAQQGVVVGIRPPSDRPSDILLSNGTVKEKQPAGTVIGAISVDSEATNPEYEFSIRGEYSIVLHDYIKAPFVIEEGELKTTEILDKEDGDWTIEITVTNTQNHASLSKTFTIYVTDASETAESPASNVALGYDKTKQELSLTSLKQVSFLLYTSSEDVIAEGTLAAGGTETISLSEVDADYCILRLTNASGHKEIKIITQNKKE